MIQHNSRTTLLLGSSLNSSQLSLYSHASSKSGSSRYNGAGGRAAELARLSSGGQASKAVSGHGYLTSSRTVSAPKGTLSKSKGAFSQARERRKQERRRAHTADEEESLVGDAGVKNDDLESYLMSFGGAKAGRPGKATAKWKSRAGHVTRKTVFPQGSELDWDKLLESGGLPNETQSEDDDIFTDMDDPGDLDGSSFLKKRTKMDSPITGPLGEQTKDKLRRISNVSSDIKFLGENSVSPSVSDLLLSDSLDTSSTSNAHAPMATEQPRHHATRNPLSESNHSLERNALKDVVEAGDLISSNEIDVDAVHSPDRSKLITMRNRGANFSDSVTISEEQSISESFDFNKNVLSSIDQLEADINGLHHQSEESSFEQNLHDVHSLRELEESLEDPSSHNYKGTTKSSTNHDNENNVATKSSTLMKREESQAHSPQPKPKLSGFKFSASNPTIEEVIPDKQQKAVVSYSSDEFESESVSEVESLAARSNDSEDTVKEELVITHSDGGGELEETVASGDSDNIIDVEDRTETRHHSGAHSELSYSSFSEAEQMDKSELTESQQQMEQLASSTTCNSHPSSTSKDHSTPPKPSTTARTSVQRDACVQTEPLAGSVSSSQPAFTGYPSVTVGYHYGKEYLDPSPILPHVISPDALEAVTGYSPSVVALTDMLRTHLSITQSLVAHNRQLAATVSSSITPNYHYTTLEETKQYIARHRPKLLTFEEAKKLVQSEHQ